MAPTKKLSRKEVGLTERPGIIDGIFTSMNKHDAFCKQFTIESDPEKIN